MSLKIKHKRSGALNSPPTTAQIEQGEIGINYNKDSLTLYVKDSAGAIRAIAGDGSQGPGKSTAQATAPSSPADGDLWINTSKNPPELKLWNATASKWVEVGGRYTYPGGVDQTVQARLEHYLSVKDFGAVGDGVTDDSVAFQNAIDNAIANLNCLHIPAGNYKLTRPLITEPISSSAQERAGIKIFGDGTKTVLDFSNWDTTNYTPGVGSNASDLYAFTCVNDTPLTNNWTFDAFEVSDFKIIGPGANYQRFNVGVDRTTDPAHGGYGPDAQFPSDDFIEGLHGFGGASNAGGYIVKNIAVKGFDCGFRFTALQFCYLENLRASKNRIGCWLSPDFAGDNAGGNSNIYNNCYFTNNFVAGAAVVGASTPFPFQNMEFNNLVAVGNTLTGFYAYGAGKITLKGYQTEQNGYYDYPNKRYNLESTFNFNGPTGEALTIKNGIINLTSSSVVLKAGPANTNIQPIVLEDGSRIEFNDGVALPAIGGYINSAGNWVNTISGDSFIVTNGYTPQKTVAKSYPTLAPVGRYPNQRDNSIGTFVEGVNTSIDLTIPNSAISRASAVSAADYPATVETGYVTTANKQFLTDDPEYGTVQKCKLVTGDTKATPCRIELSSDILTPQTTDASGYNVATSGAFVQFLVKFSRTDEDIVFDFMSSFATLKSSPLLVPNKWYLLQMIINNKSDLAFTFYLDISAETALSGNLDVSIARMQAFTSLQFDNLNRFYRSIATTSSNQSYNPGNNQTRYITRANSPEVTHTKNSTTGKVGDVVYDSTPTAGGYLGWVCVAAGTPGTWKGFGLIES